MLLQKALLLLVLGAALVHSRHRYENKKGISFGDETELDFQDDFAPPSDHAKTARDLVHRANWTSFGTVSSLKDIAGFPMVSVQAISDSRLGASSTGRIYFYIATETLKYKDLVRKNQATLLFSDAQDGTCQNRGVDEMEPTCMRTMITGQVYELKNGTDEFEFGQSAFVSRHPIAQNWLNKHDMLLCRLHIQNILVIDFYGGAKNVSVDAYYNYKDEPRLILDDRPLSNNAIIYYKPKKASPPSDHAEVARYLVHNANWTAFGTISTVKNIKGYPMVSISSVADSRSGAKSTGDIYFYIAKETLKYKDLIVKNQATLLFSDAQNRLCESHGIDPMEPTCMRTMISGKVVQLKNGSAEFEFGRAAFVSRHPSTKAWLNKHNMVFCKLEINNILVIDYYGGSKRVNVKDYYKELPFEPRYGASLAEDEEHQAHVTFGSKNEHLNSLELQSAEDNDLDSNKIHIRIHKSRSKDVIDIFV